MADNIINKIPTPESTIDGTEQIYAVKDETTDARFSAQKIVDKALEDVEKDDVGLGNVDDTSDADKPISTAAANKNTAQDNAIALNTAKRSYPLVDENKLSTIEENAKDDQTGAEIKSLYEAESNTNAFTDSEKSKLAGLDDSLFLGVYASLGALQTAHASPAEGSYAYVDAGIGTDITTYVWDDTDEEYIEGGGSGSETSASIKSKYEANADTNAYTDAEKTKVGNLPANTQSELDDKQDILSEGALVDGDKTKLDGIEAGADKTDTDNVRSAGALMDDEVPNLSDVKSFDPSDYATDTQGAKADTATQPGDLAAVATSGDYDDLSNKPDLSVYDEVEQYADLASFPATGNSAKFYLAQDTGLMYRWTGATYAVISAQLALGETLSTAYRGDRGKTAYDHSQDTTTNPHGVTKSQVGLGNVNNTADADKPISDATQSALDDKADDDEVVHLEGTEIIPGAKIFSTLINANAGIQTDLGGNGKALVTNLFGYPVILLYNPSLPDNPAFGFFNKGLAALIGLPEAGMVSGSGSTGVDTAMFRDSAGVWEVRGLGGLSNLGQINMMYDRFGAGSPEGSFTAPVGATYRDTTDGILYVKTSGTDDTGWETLVSRLNVKSYGATGDGTTDDTEAIQNAIDVAEAIGEGTELHFPIGTYKISETLRVSKGIHLTGIQAQPDKANGSPTNLKTVIQWDSGVTGDIMILWKSATDTYSINRGGIDHITLDGNNTATLGMHMSSPAYTELNIITYRTVTTGILIDDSNNSLSNGVHFKSYEHYSGNNAAAWGSNGLFIDGDTTGNFCTNVICDSMEAEIVNGHALTFRAVDSCNFQRVKTGIRNSSGGTGYNVRYLKSTNYPTFHAYKNYINMLIAGGSIYYGDFCKANIIDNFIAEASTIVYESDGADQRANHIGKLLDRKSSAMWSTHKYILNDYHNIPLQEFVAYGTSPTLSTVGALSAGIGWKFAAGPDAGLSFSGPNPIKWGAGYIRGIRLVIQSVGSSTGDALIKIQGVSKYMGQGSGTFTESKEELIAPTQGSSNEFTEHEILFDDEIPLTVRNWFCLTIERLGSDVTDTYGQMQIVGAEIMYRGKGPDSAASYGPYELMPLGGYDAHP